MPPDKPMITMRAKQSPDTLRFMVVIDCKISSLLFSGLTADAAAPALLLENPLIISESQSIEPAEVRVSFTSLCWGHQTS